MKNLIPLSDMTVAEKLLALEEIWSDLQQVPEQIPSPSWHADMLRAREARVADGTSHYSDWTEAKARLQKNTE
ncbi:MAG: addiction module protein [Candidatus Hydrogenedentes bacterium]|nr:addiction module protein [Candidatus Hydrogenedentota bacterium]